PFQRQEYGGPGLMKLNYALAGGVGHTPALARRGKKTAKKTPAPPAPATTTAPAPPQTQQGSEKTGPKAGFVPAAFNGKARMGDDYVVAQQPDPDNRKENGNYHVTPVSMQQLPDGTLALVTNSERADDDGNAFSAHAEAGLLSVYLFQRDGQQWKL